MYDIDPDGIRASIPSSVTGTPGGGEGKPDANDDVLLASEAVDDVDSEVVDAVEFVDDADGAFIVSTPSKMLFCVWMVTGAAVEDAGVCFATPCCRLSCQTAP